MNIKFCVSGLLVAASFQSLAADIVDHAFVVSAQPVFVQSAPRQVCSNVVTQGNYVQSNSNNTTAALIGGIAGGLLGNTVGKGNGKNAATAVGAVTGALVGNSIGNNQQYYGAQQQQVCQMVYDNNSVIVGYDVVYEYNGKQGKIRTSNHPGNLIRVGITAL